MWHVIDERRDLEDIAKLALPFVDNPLCLSGADLKAIFHVTGSLGGIDRTLLENYRAGYGGTIPLAKDTYLPIDEIDTLVSDSDYFDTVGTTQPGIYPGGKFGFRSLYNRIYIDGRYTACMVIDEVRHPLSARDFALSQMICHFLEKGLRVQGFNDFSHLHDLDAVLTGLLEHTLLDERRIIAALAELEWSVSGHFFCMAFETKSVDRVIDLLYGQAVLLAPQLESQCFTVFESHLVFVFNLDQTGETQMETLNRIQPILRDQLFCAGISEPFSDFKELFYYYGQARSALVHGLREKPMQWFFRYEDYLLSDYVTRCKGRTPASALMPMSVRRLREHDQQKGSHLLELLRAYLENEMNVAQTIRQTYMHRNTFLYRLEKIEEIGALDLSDPDVRLELRFAFKLMDEDR